MNNIPIFNQGGIWAARDLRFAGGWALSQLWLFWLAPMVGGPLAGGVYRALFE